MRISKTVSGITTRYYYDGDQLLAEDRFDSSGNRIDNIVYIYDNTGICGFVYNNATYYLIKNALGDTIKILNESRVAVATYAYTAFGECTVTNLTGDNIGTVNPIRYRGYYQDNETGFYYLNTRYYDPEICRFINADNIELVGTLSQTLGQLNMYAYCNNNPIMYTDPKGEFILTAILISFAIGALAGVAAQFLGDIANAAITGNWTWSSWENYVGSAVGYGVCGVLTMIGLPTLGLAAGSGLSTFVGMSLEKATGTNDRSWEEIGLMTAGSIVIGAVMGQLSKGLSVNGITAGRNSWSAVYKSGLTKLKNDTAKLMSLKIMAKGFGSSIVSKATGNLGKGLLRGARELYEI